MTILAEFYASDFRPAPICTLELRCAAWAESLFLCEGFKDRLLTLEDGRSATFRGCGIDVQLPASNNSGNQRIGFAIDNVDGRGIQLVDQAVDAGEPVELVFRLYLSDWAGGPAEAPTVMDVLRCDSQKRTLQIEAGFFDLLNTQWPRFRYSVDWAPGLTYI